MVLAASVRFARNGSRVMRTWNDISRTLGTSRNLKATNPFRSKKFQRILINETKWISRKSPLTFQKTKGIIAPNLMITITSLSGTKSNLQKKSNLRKMSRSKKKLQERAASKVAKSSNRRKLRTIVTSAMWTSPKQSSLKIISGAKNTSSRWSKPQSRWRLTPRKTRRANALKNNQVQICQIGNPTNRVQVSSKSPSRRTQNCSHSNAKIVRKHSRVSFPCRCMF